MGEVLKTVRTLIVPNQAVATYVTQWKYDSHNRLLEMIYPDEEKVTYGYNLGGQVDHVRGYKSYGYDYVNKIGYDKFEQRTYLKYCNGAETFYSYDPARRRLQNLVVNAKAGIIMDNAYSYDAVSNVLGIKNNAPLPQSGKAGGQMSHSYTYDPLYRLASATGTYKGTDNKSASYTLSMGYDNMHRITSKKQHLSQTGVQFEGTLNAGYDLTYTYQKGDGKKFQLDNVRDINYRTEETPTESTNINNGHKYTYDANGNLVYINTSRVKKDGKEDEKATEQKYRWDEENRLLAADENGFVSNYWYDTDGERTVKTSGENEAIYVNSEFSGGNTGTARFSLYVSPYLVAGQGGKYTKHIYIGSQRIVSKLGDLASYGADPRRIPYAGNEADGLTINYKDKYNQQLQSIKDNYKAFDQPYNGKDNDDYVNGQGFCCNDDASTRSAVDNNFHDKDNYEKMQFYYHPDHLGSSSYITNLDGEVAQHIEYVPFGEVFLEERNNTWNTPYLFNAKEFDEETGMYYYGARYYEPKLSLWLSVDPLEEKYPSLSTYCYAYNNPIQYIDVKGEKPKDRIRKGIASTITNAAERAHSLYLKIEKMMDEHPVVKVVVNKFVSSASMVVASMTDMNPNTMGWGDLTHIWLYELGDYKNDVIVFGQNAKTTNDLKHQEGVLRARNKAIQNISKGSLKSIQDTWVYGQKEFYEGIQDGNVVTSFLGSYNTNVNISKNKDGSYNLNFTVTNTTGWESGTRLRKDNNHDGQHDAIIPNKMRGEGIRLGGNIKEIWKWTEIVRIKD